MIDRLLSRGSRLRNGKTVPAIVALALLLVALAVAGCPGQIPVTPTAEVVSPTMIASTPTFSPVPSPTVPPPKPVETATPSLPLETQAPLTSPTPEARCRHDKMESGLSALVYTREHIKESPPAPGSEIDKLLSRPDIRIGVTFNYRLEEPEIARLDANGVIFDRLPNGQIAGQRFSAGSWAGKWDIGVVIPWDLVCWLSDQDYVFGLRTSSFPGMRLN